MTNKPRGVLYVGITADLGRRLHQQRDGKGLSFCKRYNLTQLVLAEQHGTIEEAISREKALKTWKRQWKIELIEAANPTWLDFSNSVFAF